MIKARTIYLSALLLLWCGVFLLPWRSSSPEPSQATAEPFAEIEQSGTQQPATTHQQSLQKFQNTLPTPSKIELFVPITTPRIAELRSEILKPLSEIKDWSNATNQSDAMGEIAKIRTPEAASVLAELLFAKKEEFFKVETINGEKQFSFSFECMHYLYTMLEGVPLPVEGDLYLDKDVLIWQKWWLQNKDRLVFRDVKKVAPFPPR